MFVWTGELLQDSTVSCLLQGQQGTKRGSVRIRFRHRILSWPVVKLPLVFDFWGVAWWRFVRADGGIF